MEEETKNKTNTQIEEHIKSILEEGISNENVNMLGKLVDIHKDIANEDYWKIKEEKYMREYGRMYPDERDYGRRGRSSSRGRYRGYGHSPEEKIEEMMEYYENYNEANEEMYRGNYGAEGEMVKSVEAIMKNVCEIVEELAATGNPEVMRVIKKHAQKISEMV